MRTPGALSHEMRRGCRNAQPREQRGLHGKPGTKSDGASQRIILRFLLQHFLSTKNTVALLMFP